MLALVAIVAVLQVAHGSIDDFPYMATLYPQTGYPWCWGALIAPRHVLTSAHCIGSPFDRVELGSEKRQVVAVAVHPQFDHLSRVFDLAVIKLNRPSSRPTARIQWADLDASKRSSSRIGGNTIPMYRDVSIVPNCTAIDDRVDPTVVCAVGNAWVSLCGGTSGRPLLVDDQVVAVAGVACSKKVDGDSSTTTMYARVASSRSFLEPFLSAEANENPIPSDPRPSRPPKMYLTG